jgi:hypothetical protein
MANIFNDFNKLVNGIDKAIRITDKLLSEKPKPKPKPKPKKK